MKKLLCLLFAAFLLCVSASALELPSGLDDIVPRELIDNAETGNDLLLRGGQYLFSHFRAALQDAVANSLRGAMALMLLSLLCGLVESTAESAGETPTRYAGYLGVLGAAALSAGDLSALIGLGVETMLSGPLGGDQQIGARVAVGDVDYVVFLRDPLTSQPHEPDINALLRLCDVHDVPLATNRKSAHILLAYAAAHDGDEPAEQA